MNDSFIEKNEGKIALGLMAYGFFSLKSWPLWAALGVFLITVFLSINHTCIFLSSHKIVDVTFGVNFGDSIEHFKSHEDVVDEALSGDSKAISIILIHSKNQYASLLSAYFFNNQLYKIRAIVPPEKMAEFRRKTWIFAKKDLTDGIDNLYYILMDGHHKVDVKIRAVPHEVTIIDEAYSPSHGMSLSD